MHEFELGVWKAIFIHLLRILDCLNKTHDLDQRQVLLQVRWPNTDTLVRFWEIPPFGIDGIRKITSNRSELKKLTAHDYEDLLLVCGGLMNNFNGINVDFYSVLYQFLMAFWMNPTILVFSSYCLSSHTGMASLSSACTQTLLWTFYPMSLHLLVTAFVHLKERHVLRFKPGN